MIKLPPLSKRLYTLKESAIYLAQGLHTVRDHVHAGRLPFVKSGRKIFVDIHDLDRFIESHKVMLNE